MSTSWIFLLLMDLHATGAVAHTLKYLFMTSSGVPNFPEFVAVRLMGGALISQHEGRVIPTQDWMLNVAAANPKFLKEQIQFIADTKKTRDTILGIVDQCLNLPRGVHIFQNTYGCSWDNETTKSSVFYQFGYDGEDFLSFDLITKTWIASPSPLPSPSPSLAVFAKDKLDSNNVETSFFQNVFPNECIHWLKMYLDYGRSSLLRTEFPSVSLLQKTPSSPVICHATGFYPDKATLMWRKDEKELCNSVVKKDILPNHDGTFQMSVALNLSSVKPEDWGRYDCQFQFSGMKESNVSRLDKDNIQTNWVKAEMPTVWIVIGAVVGAFCFVITVCSLIYNKCTHSSAAASDSEGSRPPIVATSVSTPGVNNCPYSKRHLDPLFTEGLNSVHY